MENESAGGSADDTAPDRPNPEDVSSTTDQPYTGPDPEADSKGDESDEDQGT